MGVIVNNSSHQVWITAGNKKHCLSPGESSSDVIAEEADGLLLDGRPTLFDSTRTDLGGGTINREGAIKVCTPGTLTVTNGQGPIFVLKAEISITGFICNPLREPAGYHDIVWCQRFPGWDINTAPVGRTCP
jgi:hypothetical protein